MTTDFDRQEAVKEAKESFDENLAYADWLAGFKGSPSWHDAWMARAALSAPLDKEAEQGKILNAPDRIYLVCGDLEDIDDPVLFRNLYEVTWCEDRINETDIEYVRNGETK